MGNYISKLLNNLKPEEVKSIKEDVLNAESLKRMKESIQSLVTKNVYSDLIVVCGNDRYPCHRAVLCLRSDWFAKACGPLDNPLELADGEYAHVVAAVLTYVYALDYNQSGQLLTWGVPLDEDIQFPAEANEELEDGIKQSDAGSSMDYDLVDEIYSSADSQHALNANGINSQLLIETQQPASEDDTEFARAKDTSVLPSHLIFHAQVFCAALKLGIPCLAKVAKHRCMTRLRSKDISNDELLGAIPKIFRPDMLFVPVITFDWSEEGHLDGKFAPMQNEIVRIVRKRFPKIKENASFEEVVITCPEFGRDILRLL